MLWGDITVTFRLWRNPEMKAGHRYRVASRQIEVDSIELTPLAAVDDEDLTRFGEADRETLHCRDAHAGPIQDDTLPYRMGFHVVE